ncbi:MAG: serine--tRNA ligase [Candidatus Woesearchaeota archaeon]|nr:serine--tRNA ligase [Candidatus Woesearchaeota archaeon]MDP7182004.1 serine--tRNA ligase [Candidatus Woesearchaeota archaeon]MDP7198944.1 serine--tRNA ligase [Candidatus Woesearchaeota archaeon]MDP7467324.1 serine--tRNA ligase [Candidatus Woesearchaeota archaeon]MDP7646622.1 serine--tRNA ligase [Candidatus Woesearchaeota archaeon]
MISMQDLRENPAAYKADCEKRHKPQLAALVDEVLKLDENWKEHKKKTDDLRAERNKISKDINTQKKAGGDVEALLQKAKDIPAQIQQIEQVQNDLHEKINVILRKLPNLMHESVPEGKTEADNPEIRKWGKPKKGKGENHGEWAEAHGLADFDTAAKVSGAGFNYLKEELALLDISLQRYAIDFMRKQDFKLMEVPMMLRQDAYAATTPMEDFEDVMYSVGKEHYLIATAEHPLMAQFWNKTVSGNELPLKIVGVSPAWRKEIGSRGVDTKGLFRMHQFNKVEQIVVCKPDESYDWFEKMQGYTEEMVKELGIPYRVIEICSGDLSIKNAKQYDIEAWFPRQDKYAEITSASNCTTWQAQRLNFKASMNNQKITPHTLNNTALATSRIMVAILENFQNKDGKVDIPKCLHKYTGFKQMG